MDTKQLKYIIINQNIMKKSILTYIIATISLCSYGQISFGLKAGLNINSLGASSSVVADNYKSNLGFHFGVYGQVKLNDRLFFIPELQFNQRGASTNSSTNTNGRINLNYIDFPILFSYQPIKKISIDLGPNLSYKLSAVATSGSSSNNVDNLFDKNFDIGVSTGVRFNVTDKISIIGRYYYAISSVTEITYADINNNKTQVTLANRTLQFGISYKLLD